MYKLSAPFQEYTLCRRHECDNCEPPFPAHDGFAAELWLRSFRNDSVAMEQLRRAAFEYDESSGAPKTTDEEVLAAVAALIITGRVLVCGGPVNASGGGGGGGGGVDPGPDDPDPPKPKPKPEEDPKGTLAVEVYDDNGELITEDVEITATGPESLKAVTKNGKQSWSGVNIGVYSVTAKVPKDLFDAETRSTSSSTVPPSGTGRARLDFVWLLNTITPKIELEYKVVLMDRGLSAHQAGGEDKIATDNVTRVELSATESTKAPPYLGVGGSFEAPNCEVFRDKDCKTPLAGKIPKAELIGSKLELWLRAKTPGPFKATLTMDPSNNARVIVKGPAEEDMGVVELEMTLHEHDVPAIEGLKVDPDVEPIATYHTALKDKALPDQKALTDADKIAKGRLLHAQNAGHHGRAKLIVKKLKADQWPGGTDDYDIVLADVGGKLALHGKEADDDAKATPLNTKVSVLKGADQTFWVEGKAASAALRDARLSLGLDRGAGGLAKTPKANGDWARFTVVKIEEMKLEYTKGASEFQAWDAAKKRFFINVNRKGDPDGRKLKFSAKITPAVGGVSLRFMLAPDKDNAKTANWNIDFPTDGKSAGTDVKWKDVPADLKHKDKTDRKDIVHLKKDTGVDGKAEMELQLSRWGGDKFHPAVYIDQDPHLGKYVHGHADLAKREPKFATDEPVQVWRKVWYQVTRPATVAFPDAAGFDASQQKVFLDPLKTEEKLAVAGDFTIDPHRPHWQFNPGGSTDAKFCIGTHNVDNAIALMTAETVDTTPKFHVIMCEEQYDAKDNQTDVIQKVVMTNAPVDLTMTSTSIQAHKVTIIDPPLQGGALVVTSVWRQAERVAGTWNWGPEQPLPAANVAVVQARTAKNQVRVTPPAGAVFDADHGILVRVRVLAADGGYAGWAPENSVASVVKGGGAPFSVHDVMAHEMGHLFGKARFTSRAGLPDHPLYYQRRGGSGTHCAYLATWTPDPSAPALNPTTAGQMDAQGNGAGRYDNGECIMFGIASGHKLEWCEHCALDFLFIDMSKFGG